MHDHSPLNEKVKWGIITITSLIGGSILLLLAAQAFNREDVWGWVWPLVLTGNIAYLYYLAVIGEVRLEQKQSELDELRAKLTKGM